VDGIDPKTGRWDWSVGRLAFIDVESTGVWDPLDPPLLLEAAVVVTDRDLTELARYTVVIKTDPEDLAAANPFAVTMHLRSGLWQELQAGEGVPIPEAEVGLCRMLANTDWGDPRPVVWVGSSPAALDRPLIQRTMPSFYDMLHYRSIDVSSLRLVLQNYAGIKLERTEPQHRALSDAFGALDHLRAYKERLALLAGVPA
jgi:oligoribonuclease (3'-5' exoribonuclease)